MVKKKIKIDQRLDIPWYGREYTHEELVCTEIPKPEEK